MWPDATVKLFFPLRPLAAEKKKKNTIFATSSAVSHTARLLYIGERWDWYRWKEEGLPR